MLFCNLQLMLEFVLESDTKMSRVHGGVVRGHRGAIPLNEKSSVILPLAG